MIEVIELPKTLEPRYSAFVAQQAEGMIYWTLEFRDFLQRVLCGTPRYFLALDGSTVVGVLPCFESTHVEYGKLINSLPWFGSHGGCLVQSSDQALVRKALLDRYRELVNTPEVSFATLVLSPQENLAANEYAAVLIPDAVDGRIGQVTTLPMNGADIEDRLESTISQKTRNLARKSRKQGFELSIEDCDEAWRFLHETHAENMEGIGGRAKPWAHFVAMREAIPSYWRQLMIARLNGEPIAAMLIFRFNQTVEYITPVIKHEFRSLQPLSFLIWHGMLNAARDGFRLWNWGGTWATQTSLHHFKAGWGTTDQPYSYLIHAKPRALDALRKDRKAVSDAFPFYFTYPFHLIE
ncbi:MAG: GNAT family N-acetyltransferase [Pseudomonadota bacterium]